MATKRTTIIAILALAAAAIAVALVLIFTKRGGDVAPGDPYNEPYARMKDPDYLRQLKVQREDQKEIMRRMVATREEIAALGDDTNSAKYVELRARLESEAEELHKNNLKSQAIVRERINKENEAIKAKNEALKQKGN
jgi:hypothetical protein